MRFLKKTLSRARVRILLVILLVSGLTGIIVGTASYYIARSSIRKQLVVNLSNMSNNTVEVLDHVWMPVLKRQIEMVATAAGRMHDASKDVESIKANLQDALDQLTGFKRLSVFMPDGLLLASSDPNYNPERIEELANLEASQSVVIPFRKTAAVAGGEITMTVASPIILNGETVGSLAGDVDPLPLSRELGSKRTGNSGELYLVNEDGQLLTLPPLAKEGSGLELPGEPLRTKAVDAIRAGRSGVADYTNYDGQKVLGSYAWMPDMQWGLIVEENAGQAFTQLSRTRNADLLLTLLLVGLALLAAVFFSRRMSEPLMALKAGAEKLRLGDLGYRLDTRGGEELQSLATSFNRMAEEIQSSYERMDELVKERTRGLDVLNAMMSSLSRSRSPEDVLEKALDLLMRFVDYDMGWTYLAEGDEVRLVSGELKDSAPIGGQETFVAAQATLRSIMEGGRAVFVDAPGAAPVEYHPVSQCLAMLPLLSPQRVLGLICIASSEVRPLSDSEKAALKALADEIAIYLDNAVLYNELRDHVKELERANRELRGLDEMKSNFISAVSHELKQPLALISGYAQTMHNYYESLTYEEEMQCLRVIMERTQFLTGLVEDLLDLSMLEMGRMPLNLEELDLPSLAWNIVEAYGTDPRQVKIEVDFPQFFPIIVADARRIGQVLSNLLSNAVKFSRGEGRIRLVGIMIDADVVRVSVEDLGVGIDPGQLEKIFDRFYQADASTRRPYSGVGLACSCVGSS